MALVGGSAGGAAARPSEGWAGRAIPRVQGPLGAPQRLPALRVSQHHAPVSSRTGRSPVARCHLSKETWFGVFLILLISVCFLQGKKKKRKRDKQPGETNGK